MALHRRPLLSLLLLVAGVNACTGDDGAAEIDSSAYVAALEHFLPPPPGEDAERPVVYIAPTDDLLSLDLQVGVIDELADQFDVRFVDDYHVALDGDSGEPQDGSSLVGLGTASPEPPHHIRVEIYEADGQSAAYLVEVHRAGRRWVSGEVAEVTPEELVGDG